MIIVPLIPFLRRRRIVPGAPPAPPATITIVSVTADGSAYGAVWAFSAPIVLSGATVPQLEIDGEGEGFIGPDDVEQIGPSTLGAHYWSSSGIEVGDAWRITAPPAGITPGVVVPQGGNVGA
jgi:hypothetical protein